MPAKTQKPKYPVREYLGKYHSWIVVMHGYGYLCTEYRDHDRFFDAFPNKTGLEQFNSVDVTDYRVLRISQGVSENQLRHELQSLRKFWRWLVEDQKLTVVRIQNAFDVTRTLGGGTTPNKLSLSDVKAILAECPSNKVREAVLNLICGGKNGTDYRVSMAIRDAGRRAGLKDFKTKHLKVRVANRFAQAVLEDYCQQLRNSFPLETKSDSCTFGTIQASSLNERPTISNSDYEPSASVHVN
jgi:site-specific recombinase XerD